jgi:2-oxo-4-hydroxy-4-carboxy-5-ureidoimidazoline decarboxylase
VKSQSIKNETLLTELQKCCGSSEWVKQMSGLFPLDSENKILKESERVWFSLDKEDRLEAFLHHPKIGDINSLREKYSSAKNLSEMEQLGVNSASEVTLTQLAKYNKEYEEKFGFIFIVCATGKSAEEMLELIKIRIQNDTETEIQNASAEQNKITQLRLSKIKDLLL